MAVILPGTYVRIAGAMGSEGPFRGAGGGSSYGPGSSPNPGIWNNKYGTMRCILSTKDGYMVQTNEKAFVVTKPKKLLVPVALKTQGNGFVETSDGFTVAVRQK